METRQNPHCSWTLRQQNNIDLLVVVISKYFNCSASFSIKMCSPYNSTPNQTQENDSDKEEKGRRIRTQHTLFTPEANRIILEAPNGLIFLPLDLPAWRSTSVARCSESEGHN